MADRISTEDFQKKVGGVGNRAKRVVNEKFVTLVTDLTEANRGECVKLTEDETNELVENYSGKPKTDGKGRAEVLAAISWRVASILAGLGFGKNDYATHNRVRVENGCFKLNLTE